MKRLTDKRGLTLLEIVVSVAIIVILTAIVIGTAVRIETRSKEQLMENTFALINAALAEFKDYGFNYDPQAYSNNDEREFYLSLDFPVDCNDYPVLDLMTELGDAFGGMTNFTIISDIHEYEYSGCEAMYFMLRRVPKCRRILDKIDDSLITNADPNTTGMRIEIDDTEVYPLNRIIDPWGRTLRYDYYDENESTYAKMKKSKRTFPVLTSAGVDRIFGTSDDMKSRKR